MSAPVFVVDAGAFAGVGPGDRWVLTGPEARHASSVQRLRAGESIDVVDGAGNRLRGEVAAGATPAAVEILVREVSHDEQHLPRLVLVQALAKGGRDEMALEAATELGVDAVRPWQSERSVVQWRGDKVTKGEQRWHALAHAATKVARRSWLPQVLPFVRGNDVVDTVRAAVAEGATVIVLHEEATDTLHTVDVSDVPEVIVIVGPEGGLSEAEVGSLVAAGAHAVLIGKNVLRASTAGPAALAVLAFRTGRWS